MEREPHETTGNAGDGPLWERFRAGDKAAYALIYETHVQALFHHGARYTPDRELLADVIQDLFVRLYQRKECLGNTINIRLYLLAALKHDLFNHFTRHRSTIPLPESGEVPQAATAAEHPSAEEEEEEARHRSTRLRDVLVCLPARQREVIRLRFVEELKYDEIAALMEMNYQSVHNLIQRALKKMRKTWDEGK
jgi:RNA polymerase sigma-70 factor (ECF subfamily)